MANYQDFEQYLANPNVKAFLDVIADGEGAGYNTRYGGGSFNSNGPHPCNKIRAGKYNSDAAGRYQFLCSTWAGLVSGYGLPNAMTAHNQDLGAVILLSQKSAIAPLLRGDLATAIQRSNGVWPSLAGGSQQTRTMAQNINKYINSGGSTGAAAVLTDPAGTPVIDSDGTPGAAEDGLVVTDDLVKDDPGTLTGLSPGLEAAILLGVLGIAAYILLK